MIALMGLDAETGVFMLLFLDLAYDEAKAKGRLRSMADLHEAIVHGAVKRLRPKMMTVTAAMIGLMPIMWSIGTGLGRHEAGGRAHGRRPGRGSRPGGAVALGHRGSAPPAGAQDRLGARRRRTSTSTSEDRGSSGGWRSSSWLRSGGAGRARGLHARGPRRVGPDRPQIGAGTRRQPRGQPILVTERLAVRTSRVEALPATACSTSRAIADALERPTCRHVPASAVPEG